MICLVVRRFLCLQADLYDARAAAFYAGAGKPELETGREAEAGQASLHLRSPRRLHSTNVHVRPYGRSCPQSMFRPGAAQRYSAGISEIGVTKVTAKGSGLGSPSSR
jgi:hypothetical protein